MPDCDLMAGTKKLDQN